MLITVISFLLILSIIVLIHELGHFLVAKKLGIKVEEFGIGFPPRAYGKKIGETIYSINWLPIGGFVKLYGEDEAGGGSIKIKDQNSIPNTSGSKNKNEVDEDVNRAFYARPIWQRMTVVVAGVVMNFILAVVLISYLFATQGVALPSENVIISEISKNSPAYLAEIKPNDQVIKINNIRVKSSEAFIKETKNNRGKEVTLVILRDNKEIVKKLTPRIKSPEGEGAMGVSITDIEVKKYSWLQAPFYGTLEAGKFSLMILKGLGSMVFDLVSSGKQPEGVAGPIGVAQLTGEAVNVGLNAVLWFMAILSLNLAVLNILPIPALDGGRFFFQIIELIIRKKISPYYEAMAHGIGLVALLGLMILITFLDVIRLISGKSILP